MPVPGTPLADGQAAVSHWAPDPSLGSSPERASAEMQEMVAGLHGAGLAVLMQVDLVFTAEGDDDAPRPLSLRGLDHAAFYRGGGVLNVGHAVARQYIVDVLRHWALDYGIDGFEFLGAENLVQGMWVWVLCVWRGGGWLLDGGAWECIGKALRLPQTPQHTSLNG